MKTHGKYSHVTSMKYLQAEEHQGLLAITREARSSEDRLSPRAIREHSPADTLSLDFWSQENNIQKIKKK